MNGGGGVCGQYRLSPVLVETSFVGVTMGVVTPPGVSLCDRSKHSTLEWLKLNESVNLRFTGNKTHSLVPAMLSTAVPVLAVSTPLVYSK